MHRTLRIEDTLRLHPGVSDVAVVLQGRSVRAFVVLNVAYITKEVNCGASSAALTRWQKVFDLSQATKDAATAPIGFNTLGWNSSYTRQPIPADQMHEWIESTVEDLLPLGLEMVCEVGCGTGLLLMKLAPSCEQYTGLDFSSGVLAGLREQLRRTPSLHDRVEVIEGSAEGLGGLDPNSFDTVLLNSVVQYFPSLAYLTEVLQSAVDLVRDGGHVFVGDVLHFLLQPLFASSVVVFQATDETTVRELRTSIDRRIETEPQLVLSPAYFLSLKLRFPRVSWVDIRLRRDRFDNEMSRYRYHAILHVGHDPSPPREVDFMDWTEREPGLDEIRSWLQQAQGRPIGMKRIRNARLESDLATLARVTTADANETAGDLRREAGQASRVRIHPQDLLDLGTSLGLTVFLSWAACRRDGSYDAVFVPASLAREFQCLSFNWPEPDAAEFVRLANTPGQARFHATLVDQLLNHCQQELPPQMVPQTITLVDSIVRREDGGVDIDALLAAESRRAGGSGYNT